MNLIRFNHQPAFSDLFDQVFFNNFDNDRKTACRKPATNIVENDNNFELSLAIPGLNKEDIKIDLEDNLLSISSEKEEKNEDLNYSRREFSYQNFYRAFTLPKTVDTEKIKADYKNGILYVAIPKIEEAKLKKAIKIS